MLVRRITSIILAVLLAITLPVYAQTQDGQTSDVQFADPGVTPDSPFYGMETFWDNVRVSFTTDSEAKAVLAARLSDERLAEMHVMIGERKVEFARRAQEEHERHLKTMQEHIETFDAEKTEAMVEIEKKIAEQNRVADEIREELMQRYQNGELTEEEAKAIYFDKMKEMTSYMDEKRGKIIEQIAAKEGLSLTEAEIRIRESEERHGVTELHKEEVERKLAGVEAELQRLTEEHQKSIAAGEVPENDPAFDAMISQARIRMQLAQDAYQSGKYGKAFGQFNAGEHAIVNAEKFLYQDTLSQAEREMFHQRIEMFKNPEFIKKEFERMEQESKRYAEDYERNRERILQLHPERAEEMQRYFDHAKQEAGTAYQFRDNFDLIEKMKQEGRTEQEIQQAFAHSFKQEVQGAPIGFADGTSYPEGSGQGSYPYRSPMFTYDPSTGTFLDSSGMRHVANQEDIQRAQQYSQSGPVPANWEYNSQTGMHEYKGDGQGSSAYQAGYAYDPSSGKYYPGDTSGQYSTPQPGQYQGQPGQYQPNQGPPQPYNPSSGSQQYSGNYPQGSTAPSDYSGGSYSGGYSEGSYSGGSYSGGSYSGGSYSGSTSTGSSAPPADSGGSTAPTGQFFKFIIEKFFGKI